jgi:hypothetical protein
VNTNASKAVNPQGDGYVRRVQLTEPLTVTRLSPHQQLVAASPGEVWTRLADYWLAKAPYGESPSAASKSVAGPGTLLGIDDGYVLWTGTVQNCRIQDRKLQVAGRTRADGSGDQEIVAEVPYPCPYYANSFIVRANASFAISYTGDLDGNKIHFYPLPPPSSN